MSAAASVGDLKDFRNFFRADEREQFDALHLQIAKLDLRRRRLAAERHVLISRAKARLKTETAQRLQRAEGAAA